MKNSNNDQEYFDLHDILSHSALWNFIIGHRSAGKTYSFKKWAIKDFIKTGNMFIYLRRHESELEDRFTFFDDIKDKFPDYEFKVHGYYAYIRKIADDNKQNKWQLFGFFRWLSTQQNRKGGTYAKVDKICYDEFIIEDETHNHYLRNEVKSMLSFWHTVDRKRYNTRVVFLSNSASIVNPYFLTYKISTKDFKSKDFVYRAKNFICVQFYRNELAQEMMKNSPLAALSEPTDYASYAIDNMFLDDNDLFVKKRPKDASYSYCIKFEDSYFSIFTDKRVFIYYVDDHKPKDEKNVFCLTREDMTPNIIMIERTSLLMKSLIKVYRLGNLYFDCAKTRGLFYDMATLLNLR